MSERAQWEAAAAVAFSDLCAVTWIDSHIELYQVSAEDLPTPALICSVGYIAAETADYLTLARERIGAQWRGAISIPKACIRERTGIILSQGDNDQQRERREGV